MNNGIKIPVVRKLSTNEDFKLNNLISNVEEYIQIDLQKENTKSKDDLKKLEKEQWQIIFEIKLLSTQINFEDILEKNYKKKNSNKESSFLILFMDFLRNLLRLEIKDSNILPKNFSEKIQKNELFRKVNYK